MHMDHNGTPRRALLRRAAQAAAVGVLVAASAVANAQARPPLPTVATNANQESMARAITVLCPNLRQTYITTGGLMPSDQISLFDACAGTLRADSGDTSRSNALQELTGEELNAATSTTVDFNSLQRADIAARLVALRQAAGSSTLARHSPDDRSLASIGTGGAAGDESSPLGGRLGVFVNGRLGSGSKDTTSLEAGYDVDGTGVTLGADYRFNDRIVAGAAFSYGSTDTDFDKVRDGGLSGGTFDSDGYSLALFGGWTGERSYLDLIASFGQLDHESERRVSYTLGFNTPDPQLGALTETWDAKAVGETESDVLSLGASYGYNFGKGSWSFGPTLAISYLKADVDGFSERGAPGLELTYGDQEGESLQLQAGLDVAYAASMSWGVLSPYARFVFISEQENDSQVIDVRYSSDPLGTVFGVRSDDPDTSFFRWGIGASALFANGFAMFLDYDAIAGYDTVDYGEVTLGLRYSFR
jgi:outer membrane autotransporter protein